MATDSDYGSHENINELKYITKTLSEMSLNDSGDDFKKKKGFNFEAKDIKNYNNHKKYHSLGVNTIESEKEKDYNETNNNFGAISNKINSSKLHIKILKSLNKEDFLKVFNRIKLDMINSIYVKKELELDEKLIWKKIVKNEIPKENWEEFIIDEIENPKNIKRSISIKNSHK